MADLFREHQGHGKGQENRKIGLLQTYQGGWLWVTVGQKNVQGLGIQEVMNPVANQADNGAVKRSGAHRDLGDRYTLVKDTT